MAPKWFPFEEVPYDEMWPDDIYWMPKVLAGKKVVGEFTIVDEKLDNYKLDEVDHFPVGV